jgi:DNA-binding SARP family transcriptional activator
VAQQPSTTFADATDGTDLIPGSQRGVTAISDALGAGAASVADTAAALARTATSLMWSGPAADAFSEHRRAVIEHTDRMDQAVDTVRTALDGHLDALTSAQGTAGDALDLWHTAEQQMRAAKQYDTPEAQQASNVEAVRAQAVAAAQATAKRARALLNQATHNLAESGDQAETRVRAALEGLRAAHLPTLDLDAATAAATPAAESAGAASTAAPMSPAWTPPGWSGPTATVAPPADNVHDSLSRIAQRVLGDANRWPEIYQLNVGQPVGPHAVLTDPSLIQPGWVLRLPSPTAITPPIAAPLPAQPALSPVIHHPISAPPHARTAGPGPVDGVPPLASSAPPPGAPGTPVPGGPSGPATPPPMSAVGPPDTTAPTTPDPTVPPGGSQAPMPPPATTQPHPGHTPATSLPPTRPGGGLTTASADRGVNAGDGLIVAGGVAAALLVGVGAVAGIRHLRGRTNGSSYDTSLPADVASHGAASNQQDHGAPVIRRLTAAIPPIGTGTPSHGNNGYGSTAPRPGFPSGPDSIWMDGTGPARLPFGQRDGKTVLFDVAATLGLGLAGPGALNTARALLLSALSTHPDARVVLSNYDRRRLLGDDHRPAGYPDTDSARPGVGAGSGPVAQPSTAGDRRVTVERNLDGLLNEVEADIMTRFRVLEESAGQASVPPLVVITTIPADARRLQMIADLGAGLGVVVIILGGWPAGITCYVTRDGRVTDARGPAAEAWDLDGLTLFSAGSRDTRELLNLLSTAPASKRPAGTRVRRGSVSVAATRRSDGDILGVRGSLPATMDRAQPDHGVSSADGRTPAATSAGRNQPTGGGSPIDAGVEHHGGHDAEATDADRLQGASVVDEDSEVARRLNPDAPRAASQPSGIARRLNLESDDAVTPVTSTNANITGSAGVQIGKDTTPDSDPDSPGSSTNGNGGTNGLEVFTAGDQVPHPRQAHRPQRPATSTTASRSTASGAASPQARQNPSATASHAATAVVSAGPVLELQILGSFRLRLRPDTDSERDPNREADLADITEALGPRPRELLTFIALHEDGVRRDEVVDALWPDTNPVRHTHPLNTATSRLRRALGRATANRVTDLIRHADHRLQLDDKLVTVDLWQFRAAWDAARHSTTDSERMSAYRAMTDAYHGSFGKDVDADWVATPRQSLHRAATDATRNLANLLVDVDPQQTLDLLDSARNWDPFNEHLYRDIMRLQAKLGQADAIRRTFDLLAARLAEINVKPTREARELAAGLEQRASRAGDLESTPSTRSTAARPPAAAPSWRRDHPADQRRPASP